MDPARNRRRIGWVSTLAAVAFGMAAAIAWPWLTSLWAWDEVTLGSRRYLERPAEGSPTAIAVVFHAFDTSPSTQEQFFRLRNEPIAKGWHLVLPEGLENEEGKRFWNAGKACCAFSAVAKETDDVAFVLEVLAKVRAKPGLASVPVLLLGVSNGAFMAQRVACEAGVKIRGVVSVAGTADTDPVSGCKGSGVSVLHVHGTADETIELNGGKLAKGESYLSAEMLLERWRTQNTCTPLISGEQFDVDASVDGPETLVYRAQCVAADLTFWRVEGGKHRLRFTQTAHSAIIERMASWLR